MKYTYLTVCSTDNYLDGVLVLNQSLIKTNSKYPLRVLVTKNTSSMVREKLANSGIETIEARSTIFLPEHSYNNNIKNGYSHWNNTLDKLCMFELIEFDKIVYLDSDMLVLENIDELFEKKHMSAVIAGKSYPGNEKWEDLNSGCLIIEPQLGILDKFIPAVLEVAENKEYFGDQDVLQLYYKEWKKNNDLKLDEKYNVFYGHIDYYIKYLNYSIKTIDFNNNNTIKIVHFAGKRKPWMSNKVQYFFENLLLLLKRRKKQRKILIEYMKLLKEIN